MLINFKKFSSIKIGNEVEVEVIDKIKKSEKFIIGKANNLLISNNPPPLAILSKKFNYIKIEDSKLHIGAMTPNGKVVSFAKKHNLANLEFLSHLPGSIGGAIKMNAGLKEYEIFNNLWGIKTEDGIIKKEDIDFGYRYSKIDGIIFEGIFEMKEGFSYERLELLKSMRKNQPKLPSAGSCFKNPKGDFAGRLIEAVGYKGKKIGGVGFSEVHANFLVNHGEGTFDDAVKIIDEVKAKVYEKFEIELEEEIIII